MQEFDPSELASMRATVTASLPDTCTLQDPPGTPDGQGGVSGEWANAATGVPVRIGYGIDQAFEHLVADAFQGQMRATLTFAYDRTLSVKQRAVVGSRIFQIHGFKDQGAWVLGKRAYCTELQA